MCDVVGACVLSDNGVKAMANVTSPIYFSSSISEDSGLKSSFIKQEELQKLREENCSQDQLIIQDEM